MLVMIEIDFKLLDLIVDSSAGLFFMRLFKKKLFSSYNRDAESQAARCKSQFMRFFP